MPSEAFKAAVERFEQAARWFGSTRETRNYWGAKAEMEAAKAALLAMGPGEDIADAVLLWLVKREALDAGNEYTASDVITALDELFSDEPATPPDWTPRDGNSVPYGEGYTCPKCLSNATPNIVSGQGLRATCACGFSGGEHEFRKDG